ncbi:PTS sugar transporter subunit IIA [Neobacillus sp. Marseille-QA0830]
MQYILASHGQYAVETKNSCEMITGVHDNLHAIAFTQSMGAEDVKHQYEQIIEKHAEEDITIIVDILGGTPCNAAIMLTEKYNQITIVSGLSLALVIPLILGESLELAIAGVIETTKILTTENDSQQNETGEEED